MVCPLLNPNLHGKRSTQSLYMFAVAVPTPTMCVAGIQSAQDDALTICP